MMERLARSPPRRGIDGGCIRGIYVMRNPDKLGRIDTIMSE